MQVQLFIVLLVAALVATGLALRVGLQSSSGPAVRFVAVASAGGLALWAIAGLSAFELVTVADNGDLVTHSYPSLALLSAAGGAVSLFALVQAALQMLNPD